MKRPVLRVAGLVLGIAWILFGLALLVGWIPGAPKEPIAAVGLVVTGIYFLNYGLTGRGTLRKRRSVEDGRSRR